MKATEDCEDVLWAIADHPELIRTIESIFESYQRIMNQLEQERMGRTEFTGTLQTLKSKSCGFILASDRRTFYRFPGEHTQGLRSTESRGSRLGACAGLLLGQPAVRDERMDCPGGSEKPPRNDRDR